MKARGFTLLELLVVVVVIGVLAGVAAVGLAGLGVAHQAEREARRLYFVASELCDRSAVGGQILALGLARQRYLPLRPEREQWRPLARQGPLALHPLPEGLELHLRDAAGEARLPEDPAEPPQWVCVPDAVPALELAVRSLDGTHAFVLRAGDDGALELWSEHQGRARQRLLPAP